MSAVDVYFSCLDSMILPVAIPVADEDGAYGLATMTAPFVGMSAEALVMSEEPIDRAIAALLAIDMARAKVIAELDGIRVL